MILFFYSITVNMDYCKIHENYFWINNGKYENLTGKLNQICLQWGIHICWIYVGFGFSPFLALHNWYFAPGDVLVLLCQQNWNVC